MAQDHYAILGVQKDADQDTIKKAYKKLALELHPDRTGGDKAAEERFKHVNEAYATLSDPTKRTRYDSGASTNAWEGGGSGWEDIPQGFSIKDIEDFFRAGHHNRSRPRKGADVVVALSVTLAEAFTGCKKDVTLSHDEQCGGCHGSGDDPSSVRSQCVLCGGRGFHVVNRGFVSMRVTCHECNGAGSRRTKPCNDCYGRGMKHVTKGITVAVNTGISNGDSIRLTGQGAPGDAGPGDAYIEVTVMADKRFTRQGDDLVTIIDLNVAEAALGATKGVVLPDGSTEHVSFPSGTQVMQESRLKDKGMPRLRRSGRGTLKARANIVVPRTLTDEQRELLERLGKTL